MAVWCNGNTMVFGTTVIGSNPITAAKLVKKIVIDKLEKICYNIYVKKIRNKYNSRVERNTIQGS